MQQIINEKPPVNILKIQICECSDTDLENAIIAYETKPHTSCQAKGLGILIQCTDHEYGFVYHKTLLKGHRREVKFKACNPQRAIQNALNMDRDVFIFKSFEEFIQYSAKCACEY